MVIIEEGVMTNKNFSNPFYEQLKMIEYERTMNKKIKYKVGFLRGVKR